jgi:hypothetical protein
MEGAAATIEKKNARKRETDRLMSDQLTSLSSWMQAYRDKTPQA